MAAALAAKHTDCAMLHDLNLLVEAGIELIDTVRLDYDAVRELTFGVGVTAHPQAPPPAAVQQPWVSAWGQKGPGFRHLA